MKKIVLITAAIIALMLLSSCGGKTGSTPAPDTAGRIDASSDPVNSPEDPGMTDAPGDTPSPAPKETGIPEITEKPQPTEAPSAEPTKAPSEDPGFVDLLGFTADEEHIAGDMWQFPDGVWAGPLEEPQQGPDGAKADGFRIYAHREIYTERLPDGTWGDVVRHAVDGDEGYRIGSNRYGMGDIGLESGRTYRVKAVVKLSGTPMSEDYKTLYVVGVCYGSDDPEEGFVEMPFDGEWHEYTVDFTYSGGKNPNIVIGPHRLTGTINYDYECMIASVQVYEVPAE